MGVINAVNAGYSVLMSVYKAEKPEHLRESLISMLDQTLPPSQLVLVCDGLLTTSLDAVICKFGNEYPVLNVIRLPQNSGLGQALNAGLAHCRNELVVRMDSDDIAHLNRCKTQLNFMLKYNLDLCSAFVEEFVRDRQITGQRILPTEHVDLIRFARKRNPMNHPCVAFRKSMVEKVGGYRHMPYFEDYDLWARMILADAKLGNIPEPLLYMRAGEDLYQRRSGFAYCRYIIRFWREMCHIAFCGQLQSWANIVTRCAVSLLPTKGVQCIYQKKLRTSGVERQ